jgi:type II secretory pathway pseudopilin PulG
VRGFALVDVLVATGIIATGLLAMAQLMAGAVAANAAARRYSVAALLASQKVEELRGFVAGAPLDLIEYADSAGAVIAVGGGAPPGVAYVRRSTVQPLASAPGRLVIVRVTVEAPGAQTVSLATVAQVRP